MIKFMTLFALLAISMNAWAVDDIVASSGDFLAKRPSGLKFISGEVLLEFSGSSDRVAMKEAAGGKGESLDYAKLQMLSFYVMAVADTMGRASFCAPPTMKTQDAVTVVKKYIQSHLEQKASQGAYVVNAAMMEAYPCGK